MKRAVLACLGLVVSVPWARAQEMPAPEYKPGDRWVYRETDLLTKRALGSVTETVAAPEGDALWIEQTRFNRNTVLRLDPKSLVMREQLDPADTSSSPRGKKVADSDGGCAPPWPLKVGAKFECKEIQNLPNGWRVRYELKFEVEAAESVETPAGRYDTLRVVGAGYVNNETQNSSSRHERVYWYAPAVKREVKYEIRTLLRNGQPFRVEGRELMSYKPAG